MQEHLENPVSIIKGTGIMGRTRELPISDKPYERALPVPGYRDMASDAECWQAWCSITPV